MKKNVKRAFPKLSSLFKQDLCIYVVALLFLILCLVIEFGRILPPCTFPKIVDVIIKIVLTILYSYISGTFFYFFVSDIPFRRRKEKITPLLQHLLLNIKEHLRNFIEVVCPLVLNQPKNREEFCERFTKTDLHEKSFLNINETKLSLLKEHRLKIIESSHTLLAYREYLDDEVFRILNEILRSEFIRNGIIPPPDVEDLSSVSYDTNQKEVGECIYDLYKRLCEILK